MLLWGKLVIESPKLTLEQAKGAKVKRRGKTEEKKSVMLFVSTLPSPLSYCRLNLFFLVPLNRSSPSKLLLAR